MIIFQPAGAADLGCFTLFPQVLTELAPEWTEPAEQEGESDAEGKAEKEGKGLDDRHAG